jgi:hypothetical protein
LINPLVTRAQFDDVIDSYLNNTTTGSQTINGPVNFLGSTTTIGGNKILNGAFTSLDAKSYRNQIPSTTDTPLQIEFGAAQTNFNVTLTVGGRITFVTTGLYAATTIYRLGRSGSAAAANLVLGYKINGTWADVITTTLLDTSDSTVSITQTGLWNMNAGDYVDVYIIRDSSGNNDGGLYSFNPVLSGVPNVPSASTIIQKLTSY